MEQTGAFSAASDAGGFGNGGCQLTEKITQTFVIVQDGEQENDPIADDGGGLAQATPNIMPRRAHCLRSRNYVNVIVAGKQPAPQWLTMDEAIKHCTAGIGIWEWASNDKGGEPDVVMACCGDVPTLETLAAVELLRRHVFDLKIRVVNVVDLMKLQPPREHPHGLSDHEFDALFTTDKPIIFAFHGYADNSAYTNPRHVPLQCRQWDRRRRVS